MPSQNICEYKKLKTLKSFSCINDGMDKHDINIIDLMKNKINELVIEYNHLAKDFELYKKAFKSLRVNSD